MDETTKPTKGPWYVGAQNDAMFVIDQPPRPSNDDINPNHDVNVLAKVYDGPHGEANARLIAAAPDLLAALKSCDDAFAGWQIGVVPGRPEDILALIGKVRSALARAGASGDER